MLEHARTMFGPCQVNVELVGAHVMPMLDPLFVCCGAYIEPMIGPLSVGLERNLELCWAHIGSVWGNCSPSMLSQFVLHPFGNILLEPFWVRFQPHVVETHGNTSAILGSG